MHEKTAFLNAARITSPEDDLQVQSLVGKTSPCPAHSNLVLIKGVLALEKYSNEDARTVAQHARLLERKLEKRKIV